MVKTCLSLQTCAIRTPVMEDRLIHSIRTSSSTAVMEISLDAHMHMYSRYKWAMLPPTGQQRNWREHNIQYIQSKTHRVSTWKMFACMQSLNNMLETLCEPIALLKSHAKVMKLNYEEQIVISEGGKKNSNWHTNPWLSTYWFKRH